MSLTHFLLGVCTFLLLSSVPIQGKKDLDDDSDWMDDDFDSDVFDSDNKYQDNSVNEGVDRNGPAFIKHMFHYNSVMQINGRINDSLSASYTYLILAFFFDRADVGLPGFHKFVMEASDKEKANAMKLMTYMNKRGGWFKYRRIVAEEKSWTNGLQALEFMLEREKIMGSNFLYTYKIADEAKDSHLTHYLEHEFIVPRVSFIKKLGDFITNLKSFSHDYQLGEYIMDEKL